jgi:hypothetical protein
VACSNFARTGGLITLRLIFNAPLLHPAVEDLSLRSFMEAAVEHVRRESPDICEQLQA